MALLRLISSAKSCSVFRNSSRKATTFFRSSSTSSSSPLPPWLMLPPSAEEEGGSRTFNFYSLAHNKVSSFNIRTKSKSVNLDESEFVGSSHGWIALFNPGNTDLFLFNPLTGHDIKLPPMDTIYTPPNEYTKPWVDKLIITSPPDSPRGLCRAVMLFGKRLAYCTPGSSTRWMGPIDPHYTRRVGDWAKFGVYEDVVHYPKSDLLLCLGDGLEGWNISKTKDELLFDPKSQLVFQNNNLLYDYYNRRKPPFETKDGHKIYQDRHLVVHGSQIFLVIRDCYFTSPLDRVPKSSDDYPCKTVGFHVHRIDSSGSLGESESSLGGLAMFVGINHSFALRAADYPGVMPNSVYFTQHWSSIPRRSPVCSKYGGHDIGIFDYETKTISPCFYPCDEQSFKRIMPAPMWFTPTPDPCIS